ncbi:putative pentatricopeptide repeat-containing protein At3g25060, mitochondrial [Cannabis sativa]|uniref:putative pentatricopeptide repeat-containing protein At3g25060, mitochondrial n=1 Tax=Cannabis sativa TaxID=3483 RepID=UPI0029C9DFF8|nr:putative pentatricopeptide repeat-containing protein At3g25060, mitochondrial [Cannabis sativa]
MRLIPWTKGLRSLILSCEDEQSLAKVHALMILSGHRGNFNALLIKSYARIADTVTARRLFDKMPQRGVDVWNAMIIAYSREHNSNEVLRLHRQMIAEGVRPDSSSFTVALKSCACLLDLRLGEEIWFKAIEYGYKYDAFVGSSVLNLYAKCGKIDDAATLFDEMPKRDLVCWTSMISGFVRSGKPLKAVDIYRRMQKGGVEADGVVMLGLIQACVSLGNSKLGLSIHGHLIRRDQPLDVVLQTSLVDMYTKFGNLDSACLLFKRMTHKNVVSWGALISGYAQNGFAVDALKMLVEMQSSGFNPEFVSLVSALLSCAQLGFLKLGKSIHGYIVKRLGFDQVSGTAVIDMYSKCGSVSYARAVFDKTKTKDLIFWNAMITGYGIHGLGREALLLFLKMAENLNPDHTTFVSLLSAFSHSGLVEEGLKWFHLMQNDFKIQPGEKHYLCMVDLLARAGQVEEAYQLICSMDTEPGLPIWVALLAGCYNHGKLLVGEIAAKNILMLNPDDLGVYALISNFYAKENNWNEVADLKNIMKHSGIKKIPGYSAVEVKGNFHYFLMEDNSHHQHKAILHFLDKLDHEMRFMKHVPEAELLCHDF